MRYAAMYVLGLLTPFALRFALDLYTTRDEQILSSDWHRERLKAQRDR